MSNQYGWIKVFRSIFENVTLRTSPNYMAVWLFLLCKATTQDYKARFNGEVITLHPGQLITSKQSISNSFFIGLSATTVKRVLDMLEKEEMIEQKISNKNRLITIKKWAEYQQNKS